MSKKGETEEKGVPIKCAFDKDRVCNATCVAFYVVTTGTGSKFGCKRLGGLM